jgi:hypothetical protein
MVGLARNGGRSREKKIHVNITSLVEAQEMHDEGNHGGEKVRT